VSQLQQQTLLQIARGDADGVEPLNDFQRALDVLDGPRAHGSDLIE
jgi:hypothetical protein